MMPALLLSIAAAAEALSVGRSKFYELIRSQEIRTVKVGRRTLVPVDALHEYVARLRAEAEGE